MVQCILNSLDTNGSKALRSTVTFTMASLVLLCWSKCSYSTAR